MGQLPDLQAARLQLGLALESLCHDRWMLGCLRGGWFQPIAASEVSRRFLQRRHLTPLARRALYEKRPLVVNSVFVNPAATGRYDWELDWPAILYAPVVDASRVPIGLLVVGCRRDHWYTDDDVAYAQSLGQTLAPLVTGLRGPLSRLSESEGEVAQLLSYGLSQQEVARALQLDDRRARLLVDAVSRKLHSFSADAVVPQRMRVKRRACRGMTW